MRVGSLFSGIGGLDLGLEWAGMKIVWQSEIDLYASTVLRKHWPHVPNYGDIKALGPGSLPPVDLVCGGFPCQPVSSAGKRKGKDDDRWLWPYMFKIIAATRPAWVVGENVAGLITMGLDDILSDLEALGYATWQAVIPAASVQAPHIRERVFVVAHADSTREQQSQGNQSEKRRWVAHGDKSVLADSLRSGLATPQQFGVQTPTKYGEQEGAAAPKRRSPWRDAEWIVCRDGRARAVKPGVRLLADGVPGRLDQLKALGNAVVPQVAYEIGNAIMRANCEDMETTAREVGA